jgi:hypothetical protein
LLQVWGQEYRYDASKSVEILGLEYGDPKESILKAARSMIRAGVIEDKTKIRQSVWDDAGASLEGY